MTVQFAARRVSFRNGETVKTLSIGECWAYSRAEKIRFRQGQLAARRYSFRGWLPKSAGLRTVLLRNVHEKSAVSGFELSIEKRRPPDSTRLVCGGPDYERMINVVHDAAINAKIRLCGPLAWRDRPDFTCFQAGSETAAITRGVSLELGELANTQASPEVGPFALQP